MGKNVRWEEIGGAPYLAFFARCGWEVDPSAGAIGKKIYVSNLYLLSANRNIGRHTSRFTVTTISDIIIVASSKIENCP